jgi:hypothetical protein
MKKGRFKTDSLFVFIIYALKKRQIKTTGDSYVASLEVIKSGVSDLLYSIKVKVVFF